MEINNIKIATPISNLIVNKLNPEIIAFSDCLETIEEIDEENKEIFIEAGGHKFDYAPCLNDSELHVSFIKNLIQKQTSIWK